MGVCAVKKTPEQKKAELVAKCRAEVERKIKAEHADVLDFCAEHGQMFDNVKHMMWLKRAFFKHLVAEYDKYALLRPINKP